MEEAPKVALDIQCLQQEGKAALTLMDLPPSRWHDIYVMPTGMEEAPKVALDIQCFRQGGRAALTLTTNKFLHREVMAAHGLLRLEQAKQIRQMIPLPLKQTQALEKACFLINYSPKQELKQEL